MGGVQTGTVLGLPLGNLGIKSHSDVGATERHREYYMGEGGGFPRVRAVMSLVNRESPMACPHSSYSHPKAPTRPLYPPLVLQFRERTPGSQHFHCLINLDFFELNKKLGVVSLQKS